MKESKLPPELRLKGYRTREAKPAQRKSQKRGRFWHMRGANIPVAVEEDRMFFNLFQISKEAEAKLKALRAETVPDLKAIQKAQDDFAVAQNAVRARWLELVPEDRRS